MNPPATRRCRQCGETKPNSHFAMLAASKDGRASMCKACVNADRRRRGTPKGPNLRAAIIRGDLAAVKQLTRGSSKQAEWALHHAAQRGREKIVAFLLKDGCARNLDAALATATFPHHTIPFTAGHIRTVEFLLEAGSNPDARGEWTCGSVLVSAAMGGFIEITELLLAHGARTTIFTAAALGDAGSVKRMLGTNPALATAVDTGGMMPMHCCAASRMGPGTLAVAEILLQHGVGVDEVDRAHDHGLWSPGTPIAWAANGNADVAELLLERGADPNPALLQALQHYPPMADLLLRYRVDLNHADSHGQRALHHLANFPRPEGVRWLLAHDAEVDAPMEDGRTPLHRAAERNTGTGVVEMLLAAGADLNARDAAGMTPLGYAVQNEKRKVADFLRSRGGRS